MRRLAPYFAFLLRVSAATGLAKARVDKRVPRVGPKQRPCFGLERATERTSHKGRGEMTEWEAALETELEELVADGFTLTA